MRSPQNSKINMRVALVVAFALEGKVIKFVSNCLNINEYSAAMA